MKLDRKVILQLECFTWKTIVAQFKVSRDAAFKMCVTLHRENLTHIIDYDGRTPIFKPGAGKDTDKSPHRKPPTEWPDTFDGIDEKLDELLAIANRLHEMECNRLRDSANHAKKRLEKKQPRPVRGFSIVDQLNGCL